MIITAVQLLARNNIIATFTLDRPSLSEPYVIKAWTGLDAPDMNPRFLGLNPGGSGNKYYNIEGDSREVNLKITLNPQYSSNQTPSALRDSLYKAISATRTSLAELRFLNGTTIVALTRGYITRVDTDHFGKTPEVQLTLMCEESLLKDPQVTNVTVLGLSKSAPIITDNDSTAPHGFELNLTLTANSSSFVLGNYTFNEDWYFEIIYPFLNGDILTISSIEGAKELRINRGGSTIYLMDKLTAGSYWPIIYPGVNQFYLDVITFNYNYIRYYKSYWGV